MRPLLVAAAIREQGGSIGWQAANELVCIRAHGSSGAQYRRHIARRDVYVAYGNETTQPSVALAGLLYCVPR